MRALSAAAIAERLEHGLGVLGRGGALEASIEASHALLTADEQELFRRLSVFAGPFRLEDAEHVGGGDGLDHDAVLDLLVALTEHSMVQAEGGSPRRYRMLEALRDHGARAARRAARRRPPRAVTPRTSPSSRSRSRARSTAAARRPSAIRSCRTTGTSTPRPAGRSRTRETDLALDLATGQGAFHHLVGTVTLGRERIDEALALRGGEPGRRIQAMRWQIALLLCELRLPAAAAAIERARELIARHGDRRERNELRAFEAQLALCEGDLDAAARANDGVYEEALAHGERFTAAYAAWTRGMVERMRGNPGGRDRALRRRLRARHRAGRHLRARQPRGRARRGRGGRRTRGRGRGRVRADARDGVRSARSASATPSCSTRRRSPPRAAATSSARPCSPARR